MTLAELMERLAYWQRALRLQDWRITAEFVDWHVLGPNEDAAIDFNSYYLDARIRIVSESHFDACAWGHRAKYDPEHTLVHELLHLQLLPWKVESGTLEEQIQERAINHLATTLVELDRRTSAVLSVADPPYDG